MSYIEFSSPNTNDQWNKYFGHFSSLLCWWWICFGQHRSEFFQAYFVITWSITRPKNSICLFFADVFHHLQENKTQSLAKRLTQPLLKFPFEKYESCQCVWGKVCFECVCVPWPGYGTIYSFLMISDSVQTAASLKSPHFLLSGSSIKSQVR